jgi:hypothetical protein
VAQEHNQLRDWFTKEYPTSKIYPDFGPAHIATTINAKTELEKWVLRPALAQCVRCYFPGIEQSLLHHFVACMGWPEPVVTVCENFYHTNTIWLFPFKFCSGFCLSLEDKPVAEVINHHLTFRSIRKDR